MRYALDKKEWVLNLEVGTTTDTLERMVREIANGKLDGVILRTALNKSYIIKSVELTEGDEVAFIPPVQGG